MRTISACLVGTRMAYKQGIQVEIVNCTFADHGEAILDLVNETIMTSTWVYDYSPRSIQSMREYFSTKRLAGLPIIGLVQDDRFLGYASFGPFRAAWPGYKYTVEHSVFVHKEARGKGAGRTLLEALIERAILADVHVMIGAIDSSNTASIRLHERLGFSLCGTMREVGYKNAKWLDAVFYQRILQTPKHPTEA